jgi:hypothetical protein
LPTAAAAQMRRDGDLDYLILADLGLLR